MAKEKKVKTKQQKFAMVWGIVLLILFLIAGGFKLATMPKSPLYFNYILMLMPESIDSEIDGKNITFYVDKNKDYDKEKNMPIEAFSVYYYKDNNTSTDRIYLENGSKYVGETESTNMMVLNFLADANISYNIINGIIKKVLIVLCVLLGCYLIFLWYLSWSRRYDKKKELYKE